MKRHRDDAERANAGAIAIGCFLLLLLASDGDSQTIMFAGGGSNGGTVQSVAASVPAYMTVGGSPITTTGTLAFAFGSQAQGIVFASPCSGAGVPVFRALCAADIPTLAQSQVSGLTSALAAKESTANRNVANGYAGLDAGGKILSTQLPSIAITDTFVVASQAAMLALTAETGDVAIRTDTSQTFILSGTDPTLIADWSLLATPADNVTSVAGRTGAVTLSVTDVSGAEATANKNATSGYAGLNGSGKIAGTQITYGSTASTATEGNDSRLSNARTPTAHASTHAAAGSDPVSISGSQVSSAVATSTALAANGTNCSAGSYALGVDASGNAEGCTVAPTAFAAPSGTGAVTVTSGVLDSASTAFNGTGNILKAGSPTITTPTVSVIASAAGAVEAISATAASASVSTTPGVGLTITAAPAVAGTTNAGAAVGGDVTITAGAAARLTSGNAIGGNIRLTPGAGVGTGNAGQVIIDTSSGGALPEIADSSNTGHGISVNNGVTLWSSSTAEVWVVNATTRIANALVFGATVSSPDSGPSRIAPGVIGSSTGSSGGNALGTFQAKWFESLLGSNVASASTITPTSALFHVTGTTPITTINLPRTGYTGCLRLIPDGVFTTATGGNIALASTAVVSRIMEMCYDGTSWYPSY